MTTKYNIGQYLYFLSKRGTIGIQYDMVEEILISEKGTRYKIDNYWLSEGDLFIDPYVIVEKLRESINEVFSSPINA